MSTPSAAAYEQEIGARLGRGDLAGAAAMAAACRQARRAERVGWLFGSIIALMLGDRESALALVEERLRSAPDDAQCLLQKAECLLALGDRSLALGAAETAARCGNAPAHLEAVGEFLAQAGEHRGAVALYERALQGALPAEQRATLLSRHAASARALGDLELAQRSYEAVLAVDPVAPKALSALTELRPQTPERNWIGEMERALRHVPAESSYAATLHFGLAKAHADLGNHRASWDHLTAANRIERSLIHYEPASDAALMRAMEEAFAEAESIATETAAESPIFIVGLPRSGSTLVERILSNHPQLHAGGELTAMTDSILMHAGRVAGPPPADAQSQATRIAALEARMLAQDYLARTRPFRREGMRWTDKQLTNFLYCPLLLRAFPAARILHLRRRPLAACYAIYRAQFSGNYPFAYDLAEIADFHIGYRRLMSHWHRVLPGRIMDVRYEELVTDFEPTVRRLLEHIGLPFDAACLEFHRNPAPVVTASAAQVRRPLYDSSLDEWQQYAEGLAPARERLEAAGVPLD